MYRRNTAFRNQDDLRLMFYRHSDEHEEGLGLGSLIEHIDDEDRDESIFSRSKVLMYEFIRGESIRGVIINKTIQGRVRMGGPCGLTRDLSRTDKIILHNVPNVPNSHRVIEGVFWHDGAMSDLAQYRNDERYKINEYYGFASWFEG